MKAKKFFLTILFFSVFWSLSSDELKSTTTTYISPITQEYIKAIKAKKNLMKPYSLQTLLFKTTGLDNKHIVNLGMKEIQYVSTSGKIISIKSFSHPILLYMNRIFRDKRIPQGVYRKMIFILDNANSSVRVIENDKIIRGENIEYDLNIKNTEKIEIDFPHPIEFVNEITTTINIEFSVQNWIKETNDTYSMNISAHYVNSKIDAPHYPGRFYLSLAKDITITEYSNKIQKTGIDSLNKLLNKYHKNIYIFKEKFKSGKVYCHLSINPSILSQKILEEVFDLKKDPNIIDIEFVNYKEYLD